MVRYFTFFLAFTFLVLGCGDVNEIVPENDGPFFYPQQKGFYRIYAVDEINYVFGEDPDSSKYFLKELVGEVSDSTSTEVRFLVNYFAKATLADSVPWRLSYTVSVRKDQIRVVETIDNTPIIKLVYPFVEELNWDANAANVQPEDQFEMREVNEEFDNQILIFANSVSIYQSENLDSLISRDYRKEIYAKDVGLVQVELEQLEFCQESDCFGQGKIDEGRVYNQTIIEFGVE